MAKLVGICIQRLRHFLNIKYIKVHPKSIFFIFNDDI
jgi:hypothetical protein